MHERSLGSAVCFEDLLPVEDYGKKREHYRAQASERCRRRRVSLGPYITLLFESRETVLSQIQEILWIERPLRPQRIAEEIAEYERLVPRPGELTATLMLHGGDFQAGEALLRSLSQPASAALRLQLGAEWIAAEPLTPCEDATCPVQYLCFPCGASLVALASLADHRVEAQLYLEYAGTAWCSALPPAVREANPASRRIEVQYSQVL